MKKKFLALFMLFHSISLFLIVITGCVSTPWCTYPVMATLEAFDNGDSIAHAPDITGIHAKALMLKYRTYDSGWYCMKRWQLLSTNTAYAFTRARKFKPMVKIDSIHLVSDNDFDLAHPKGTNLFNLFAIPEPTPIVSRYENNDLHHLYLMHAPSDTGTHVFTVRIFLSDGTSITASSIPVKLLL